MQDDRTITLPKETVGAIRDVFDAAIEAIQELYLRATVDIVQLCVGTPYDLGSYTTSRLAGRWSHFGS